MAEALHWTDDTGGTPLALDKEAREGHLPGAAPQDIAIRAQDVSMVFNMASEQLNSLKEYFIKIARHELFFEEFRALNHISFDVKRGEAFGLVGTNGSGKSTMLKCIAGVLEPTEGSIEVRGSIAPLIELGAGFDMELTARENIYLNGALLGYTKEFIDSHFDQIIDFAELRSFMDMPLKNYSSGMVARIAFAIATITEPDILIVDETLSVGDFLFQEKCERRIRELIDSSNVTVLLVSHSIELVERMCDRVCWIEKGQQRMLGPTAEVCDAYKHLGSA
jgi:ABC-2 type transport system ATP-binding protein